MFASTGSAVRGQPSADRTGSEAVTEPILQVVIASTRPGRLGPSVAHWIYERAASRSGFKVELVDLAEVNLPLFDEPKHPRARDYVHDHTKAWSATVERADAFIFVLPEYNHGYNAALKNALDYLSAEWQYKPAGLVSYGGVAAGTRAVQMLKPVLSALRMVPLTESVNIPFVQSLLDAEGNLRPNDVMEVSAAGLLAELARWTTAMHELRKPGQ